MVDYTAPCHRAGTYRNKNSETSPFLVTTQPNPLQLPIFLHLPASRRKIPVTEIPGVRNPDWSRAPGPGETIFACRVRPPRDAANRRPGYSYNPLSPRDVHAIIFRALG